MQIYGQTLGEIFKKIPLPYQIVLIASSAFIVFVTLMLSYKIFVVSSNIGTPEFIEISKLPENVLSTLDPSITFDKEGDRVVLAFSLQTGNIRSAKIATTYEGKCNNWTYRENIGIDGKTDKLIAPNAVSTLKEGMWRIETPSIVYDPDDKGKEWKLFAYKYFWAPDEPIGEAINLAKNYGVISYKEASVLLGEWSPEKWLFSPNKTIPPKPYGGLVNFHLNDLSPELKDVTTYARPSVIYKDKILLMSLSAFTDKSTPDRTVMIASTDHGKSWIYIGSPIGENDLKYFPDNTRYKGATLMVRDDNIYLAAVFGTEIQDLGTKILAFKDPGQGKLKRKEDGKPVVINDFGHFARKNKILSGGFTAYNDACKSSGIVVSEQLKDTGEFKLIRTFKNPLD